jgi:hypothetical protein
MRLRTTGQVNMEISGKILTLNEFRCHCQSQLAHRFAEARR